MSLSRKMVLVALAAALLAGTSTAAQAGNYRKWYGYAGPCYGGFGGYPGAATCVVAELVAAGWVDRRVAPCWPAISGAQQLTPGVPPKALIMDVHLPAEAVLLVNGTAGKATGAERLLVSKGLEPGQTYTYELKAMLRRDGRMVSETQMISLRTGEGVHVAFDFQQADAVATVDVPAGARTATVVADSSLLPTTLVVEVPENAKVFLGGNPTRATGSVREFTRALPAGERMDNYTVRIEITRNRRLQQRSQGLLGRRRFASSLDFDSQENTPSLGATAKR